MSEEEVKPIVVEAVAVSGNAGGVGSRFSREVGKRIEEAMSQAVAYCYSKGITDPDKVREKMLLARENVKRDVANERAAGNLEG
jgi:hypothetical protein